MTPDDLPAALALWGRCDGVRISEGDDVPTLTGFLARNPGVSQSAFAGTELAGAVLAGHDGRRGYLYHLAVDPRFRRQGVGSILIDRALAALRAARVPRVLILVLKDNAEGREFWRRLGWDELEMALPMGIDLGTPP